MLSRQKMKVNDKFSKFVDRPEKKSYKFVLHKFNKTGNKNDY